ncbi:MAG: ATP-binding cassette domain-containing protein [Firmicutes bacterium]|nr:ATP-binding cassette domain-containing protein [Bacillota bacterium]
MNISEKEITAFIGPSGCGKTTLLKTFNRMIDLVEGARVKGSINIDGIELFDTPQIEMDSFAKDQRIKYLEKRLNELQSHKLNIALKKEIVTDDSLKDQLIKDLEKLLIKALEKKIKELLVLHQSKIKKDKDADDLAVERLIIDLEKELKEFYTPKLNINKLRKDVGMVFQKPNVFPMSIYDNIAYGPRTHGVRKRRDLDEIVADSLKKAGIWEEVKNNLNKSALSLSGGQQQRICIARALAVQPKILLMDEPTSALDPISTGIIEDLCEELKQLYTIVIVTHNMQQATRISDKTAFFLLGEMLEFGDTAQVFSNPKNEKCENYITGRFG